MAELRVLEVADDDTIIVPDYDPPNRGEYYGGFVFIDLATADGLLEACEECPRVYDFVYSYFDEERYDLECELQALPKGGGSPRRNELKAMLARMEGDDISALKAWLRELPLERLAEISLNVQKWLDEEVDSDDLDFDGYIPGNGVAFAFGIFSEEDPSIVDSLGIELEDGPAPGNNYRAAILTLSIKEANKISTTLGLKYRFNRAPDAK